MTTADEGASASGKGAKTFVAQMFVWVFLSALLARIWRATGLWQEADANDGFVWMPLGLAADGLFALIVALLISLVARRHRRVAIATGAVSGLANVAWLAMNLVSFTLTQAPITFQRARGDEGVALEAHALLRWEDCYPAIAFTVVALLALPVALALGRRVATLRVVRMRAVLAFALVCVVAYGSDAFVFRERNFGVADHPAFTLVSSFVLGAFEERRKPKLKGEKASDKERHERDALLDDLLIARTPIDESAPPLRAKSHVRNVIVIFAEGIAREHTSLPGAAAAPLGTTPNLARRAAKDGLELTRYYSPYHKSIAAIFALACADFPPASGQNIVEINARIDCGEMSDVLAAQDFRLGLFHGGDFGFYDKLMLLGMRHWDVSQDSRVMSDPVVYEENEWGIDDRAGVNHMLAWIDGLPPGQRFAATFIPITAHWPYWIPSDVDQLLPAISSKNQFLNAVHFLDGALEQLMVGLEQRGLADDTAVIFLADHGETVGERPRASAGRRLAYEPSLHVPLVILAPGVWPAGATSDRLGSHVDLLPTILDLLGLPPDARHRGTSLLAPDRTPRRLFIGASNGFKWIGWLDGNHKTIVNRYTGMREAYDLAVDPDERHNLAPEMSAAPEGEARLEQLEQEALAFADAQLTQLQTAPKVDEELDIEKLYLDVVDMHVRRDGAVVPCTLVDATAPAKSAGPRACGDEAVLIDGRKTVVAGGVAQHDCIMVRTPKNGVLELEVRAQPWMPLLTRVRVALTEPLRDGVDHPTLEAWSDGALEGQRELRADGHVRMPFASARDSLLLRVGGEGASSSDICITITERAWRNRPVKADVTP